MFMDLLWFCGDRHFRCWIVLACWHLLVGCFPVTGFFAGAAADLLSGLPGMHGGAGVVFFRASNSFSFFSRKVLYENLILAHGEEKYFLCHNRMMNLLHWYCNKFPADIHHFPVWNIAKAGHDADASVCKRDFQQFSFFQQYFFCFGIQGSARFRLPVKFSVLIGIGDRFKMIMCLGNLHFHFISVIIIISPRAVQMPSLERKCPRQIPVRSWA